MKVGDRVKVIRDHIFSGKTGIIKRIKTHYDSGHKYIGGPIAHIRLDGQSRIINLYTFKLKVIKAKSKFMISYWK